MVVIIMAYGFVFSIINETPNGAGLPLKLLGEEGTPVVKTVCAPALANVSKRSSAV